MIPKQRCALFAIGMLCQDRRLRGTDVGAYNIGASSAVSIDITMVLECVCNQGPGKIPRVMRALQVDIVADCCHRLSGRHGSKEGSWLREGTDLKAGRDAGGKSELTWPAVVFWPACELSHEMPHCSVRHQLGVARRIACCEHGWTSLGIKAATHAMPGGHQRGRQHSCRARGRHGQRSYRGRHCAEAGSGDGRRGRAAVAGSIARRRAAARCVALSCTVPCWPRLIQTNALVTGHSVRSRLAGCLAHRRRMHECLTYNFALSCAH